MKEYRALNIPHNAGQEPYADSQIIDFFSSDDKAYSIVDLTNAYRAYGASSVQRGVMLYDSKRKAIVQDELIQNVSEGEAWWFMHTKAAYNPTVDTGDNKRVTMQTTNRYDESVKFTARILSPANASFTIIDAERLDSSPIPTADPEGDEEYSNSSYKKLAIHMTDLPAGDKVTVSVLLEPLWDAEEETDVLPEVTPLNECVTADMRVDNWLGGGAYIMARYQDTGNQYYFGYNSATDRLVLAKRVSGNVYSPTSWKYAMSRPDNQYHRYRLVITGDSNATTLKVYFDDMTTPLITAVDDGILSGSAPFAFGEIGLYTNNQDAYFDNINVIIIH